MVYNSELDKTFDAQKWYSLKTAKQIVEQPQQNFDSVTLDMPEIQLKETKRDYLHTEKTQKYGSICLASQSHVKVVLELLPQLNVRYKNLKGPKAVH